jgi:2-aminoadipate transaminase
MRLNFSNANADDIREGIRRIGKVVREQIALYDTFVGRAAASPAPPAEEIDSGSERRAERAEKLAEVVQLPPRKPQKKRQSEG